MATKTNIQKPRAIYALPATNRPPALPHAGFKPGDIEPRIKPLPRFKILGG